MNVTIVGGGVYGVSAALALAARRHAVTLYEASDLPGRDAASRDISKALRAGYGPDTPTYAPLVAQARARWLDLQARRGRTLYHECGHLALATNFRPGFFEHDGWAWLSAHGHPLERLDPAEAQRRFPALRCHGVAECLFDPLAGWLDPLEAIAALAAAAEDAGATLCAHAPVDDLAALGGDAVLLAAGAWAARLAPAGRVPVRPTRQHETFFRPADVAPLAGGRLPLWSLDLALQGWYGFPPAPGGVVKVACHLLGPDVDPDVARGGDEAEMRRTEAFVADRLPALRGAPRDGRACLYAMTTDGHFLFDALPPLRPGGPRLFVAGGGSGHGFKFGPLLGEWAADLVEGAPVPAPFRAARPGVGRVI
jgi:glycine/D-amino acid oxidase-like deaminating enzyme